jgi:putative RNA 2'-phosphotransferase
VSGDQIVKLSKRISRLLRHDPDSAGLRLDQAGWIPVQDLLAALRISRAELDAVVTGNDKQRFAIQVATDGTERIRANQGHSVPVNLGLTPQPPPPTLYHGTTTHALASIRATGLHRGNRHHVHLSADTQTARRVGARRSGPVTILTVHAADMAQDGHVFYRSTNGVWLTDHVPPSYLAALRTDPEAR